MHSRAVGQSGVSVSPVGLGGFELGPEPGEEPQVDRAVALSQWHVDQLEQTALDGSEVMRTAD